MDTDGKTYRAEVKNGRLVLDEPTDLPEGTEVDLDVVAVLDGKDGKQLDESIRQSRQDATADDVLDNT